MSGLYLKQLSLADNEESNGHMRKASRVVGGWVIQPKPRLAIQSLGPPRPPGLQLALVLFPEDPSSSTSRHGNAAQ